MYWTVSLNFNWCDFERCLLNPPLFLNLPDYLLYNSANSSLCITEVTDVMKFLIEQGIEVETTNGLGLTPLLVAVLNGNFDAAKVCYLLVTICWVFQTDNGIRLK